MSLKTHDIPADPAPARRTSDTILVLRKRTVVLAALTLFLVLARLPAYAEPFEWDIGTYSVIARELLHGERLYADVWDMKPPAIFVTFALAQLLAGDGFLPVYLLSVAAAVVTMLGVYRGASVAGTTAGLWAAAAWAAMCFEPWIEGTLPNTEAFINAAVAWAFALWVRARVGAETGAIGRTRNGDGWGLWIGIGLLFALASMYKHVALAPAACMGAAALLFPPGGASRPRVAGRLALIGGAVLAAWAALLGYFAATDRAWLIWQTIVVYPRSYAGSPWANVLASFTPGKGLSPYLAYALPAVALTLIAIAMRTRAAPRGAWVLLAGLAIGTHLAVALPGAFLPHYQQLWFVPLAIGAGWGAAALPHVRGLGSPRLARAATLLALIAIVFPQVNWLTLSGEQRARRKYRDFYMWTNEAARAADDLLLPGETFYTWSDEAYAYAVAGRRPPAVGLWKSHTIQGPLAEHLTRQTIEELDRNPPELFLHWGFPIAPTDHPIYRWSRRRYEPLPVGRRYFPMFLFYRKGGALERRLAPTRPALTRPALTQPAATTQPATSG